MRAFWKWRLTLSAATLIAIAATTVVGSATAVASPASQDSTLAALPDDAAPAQWHWSDQGGQINTGISAITYDNRMFAFTRGTNGHLWVNWWDRAAWHWTDQGGQINTGISAITYDNRMFAFTRGTNGHLWVNWWG
ncbi:MAG: hypothetical protein JWP46_831 [Modestobacter sp.]|nr:hypothetical protein [Modestobacter sp.]